MKLLYLFILALFLFQSGYVISDTPAFDSLPPAEIKNGDDIDAAGNCKPYIESICKNVTQGEGALSDCLNNIIIESETESSKINMTDACREEVYQYYIQRNANLNKNIPLARACKTDVQTYCNDSWFFTYPDPSDNILSCLKDNRKVLAPACGKQVSKLLMEAAWDIRSDPVLFQSCEEDVGSFCADVPKGGGRVQGCLRDHLLQLEWDCREQLDAREAQDDGNVRLSARLYGACLKDKQKFCPDVQPGAARAKDCLEEHMQEEGFSAGCRSELEGALARRAADFRLDSRLQEDCAQDIQDVCSFFEDDGLDPFALDSGYSSVTRCLQDFVEELRSASCRARVETYLRLASSDIRFNTRLADACFQDRQKLCADVPPGSARVIRCLSGQRERLSDKCRARLFDEEVRFGGNIDFQQPMKDACEKELETYCRDVPHGQAKAIRCLQLHQFDKEFGRNCRAEVSTYERRASSDYRLNHRLGTACQVDVAALCADTCDLASGQLCLGSVLRCLTEKRESLKDVGCQKEVDYFLKMEVSDFRNDVILAAACRDDVDKFCATVEPGEGRMHACLRENRAKLSSSCRREELLLEEQEAESVELRPSLLKQCAAERTAFCADVAPGRARVFRCLANSAGDADFGDVCRTEVFSLVQRRQANWRLDPPLRRACRVAVDQLCKDADNQRGEAGEVFHCLIDSYTDLDAVCQRELGRALHMALYLWSPGGTLTSACDADVSSACLNARPNIAVTPGAVIDCLELTLETSAASSPSARTAFPRLAPNCSALVELAAPPNSKQAFDASLSMAFLQEQLAAIEETTGLQLTSRDQRGKVQAVTLTGWTALFGIAAAAALVVYGSLYAVQRYLNRNTVVNKGKYTMLVVKKPHGGAP